MAIKYLQTKSTSLTYGISSSGQTIQLKKLLKLDGTSVSASDLGDLLYGTFAPGTSREEIFSIDGANATVEGDGKITITDVVRGLKEIAPYGTGGFSCDHPAGEVVVFGNNPQVYQYLKDYIDGIAIAAGVYATTTTLGTSKLSVAPVDTANPIVVGNNDNRVQFASTTNNGNVEIATDSEALEGTNTGSTGASLVVTPSQLGMGSFGDGSDGDVTISGTTTLSRIMFYNNLTITGTLDPNGYPFFVKGTLTGSGNIITTPNHGAFTVGGHTTIDNGSPGGLGGASKGGLFPTFAGGNGGAGGNSGSDGGNSTASGSAVAVGVAGSPGGHGGAGGGGSIVGGTSTAGTLTPLLRPFGIFAQDVINYRLLVADGTLKIIVPNTGSAGGGGGGGTNSGSAWGGAGGGGGSSGAMIFIGANIISGNFGISAVGGNGANGQDGQVGLGAGGGGGAGGTLVMVYNTKTWTGTATLTGGTAGTNGTGNSGGATSATAGATGLSYYIQSKNLIR